MKTLLKPLLLLIALALLSCGERNQEDPREYGIIPWPNKLQAKIGHCVLEGEVTVFLPADSLVMRSFDYLKNTLTNTSLILKRVDDPQKATICFTVDPSLSDEAYGLTVTSDKIVIRSNATAAGFFYGVQTLLQMMPAELYASQQRALTQISVAAVSIQDAPRFSYRGAMMDVARNFLPKEAVLKVIDQMAHYKMNRFHFHLTDDQGWRIEIKRYPKLTEVGSYRRQTQVGHSDYYWPRRFDGKEVRGYYTQEEIREIVRYAEDRFITVVPEIEMPGHSSAALAAYPELSCGLEKTYVVRDYFDIFGEVFCPKDTTITFLQNVLSEVMDLFPSHYIHIGGDECPKDAWKKCPHCQGVIKKQGLKDEEALQSWFIRKIELFVNSKGRDIIGWDEILEGGLAPNATVMSWRGEKGGIEAAKQKHNVIMTPGKKCYLDYYQESSEYAPLAIGGYLPLDSVYLYDPIPKVLGQEDYAYIIGVQGNVWGEYIQTSDYFEYMAFPRLLAMAEVQWTRPENKGFKWFCRRLNQEFIRLDYRGVNACRNFYEVNLDGGWSKGKKGYEVCLQTDAPDSEIHYSIDNPMVTAASPRYKGPIVLSSEAMIYAAVFRKRRPLGKITQKYFTVNKATGCDYRATPRAEWEHVNEGFGLTDGIYGYSHDMRRWIRFYQDTVRIVVDLRKTQIIKQLSFASLWRPWNQIWPARGAKISVSTDGKNFASVAERSFTYDFSLTEGTRFPVELPFNAVSARWVFLEVLSGGKCPKGYYHEGLQSELSMDEIEVY